VAKANGRNVEIPALQSEVVAPKSVFTLFSGTFRRRSFALFAAWALISIAYYGVFVYLPIKLGAEGFAFMRGQVFLVVLAIVQLPGFALSAYGVERWGRKPTLIGFLLLSAVGCMLYSLGTSPTVVVGSTLLMSFALLGTWGALYAFTPEVYPTDLRATGMGAAGAVAFRRPVRTRDHRASDGHAFHPGPRVDLQHVAGRRLRHRHRQRGIEGPRARLSRADGGSRLNRTDPSSANLPQH
jgi:hypothetical protein